MRVKLTASCIWNVAKEDEEMAHKLVEEEPIEAILNYMLEAEAGDKEFSNLEASAEELEE